MAVDVVEQQEGRPAIPRPLKWIRLAVGVAALGYSGVSAADLVTAETSLTNQLLQLAVALIAILSYLAVGRWPRLAGGVVAGAVWLQLVMALGMSDGPAPALVVFPVLVAATGVLLGEKVAVWLGALSSLAIPAAFLVGKLRLTRSAGISWQELDWLLATVACTLGLALITGSVLSSYGRLLRDLTERRVLEERLRHTQRLETVGQLACSVAHELGNLLQVIGANAAVVARSSEPEIREAGRDIQEAELRGKALTRQLLAFGRQDDRRPERLDLVGVVRGIARLLDQLLGGTHRLVVVGEDPVQVFADRRQLEQVAMNLVTNARDAMPGGGEVQIRLAGLGRPAARALGSELEALEQAMLEVRDQGVGMSADTLARIFEPFFTTKPPGKGTGLGLSTVRDIALQAGGGVAVESAPGRGSRFRLFLPMARAGDRPPLA